MQGRDRCPIGNYFCLVVTLMQLNTLHAPVECGLSAHCAVIYMRCAFLFRHAQSWPVSQNAIFRTYPPILIASHAALRPFNRTKQVYECLDWLNLPPEGNEC
jgi:hypothetical protein